MSDEIIYSALNGKVLCESIICNWTWDLSLGNSAWYLLSVDPCASNGCNSCPYPSFDGSVQNETTTTPCS